MSDVGRMLAVIPARGGSKGLPGKHLKPFAGLPLIAHSIMFARMCPQITRCIISTDSPEIAEAAKTWGAEVPFLRPASLAQDETPLWPVLRHALSVMEEREPATYDTLLLLDPTSPAREPSDVIEAYRRLERAPSADGVIGVSRPDFNPVWHCVIEQDGWMEDLVSEGGRFDRRQHTPVIYRINGSLYLWRAAFVRREAASWRRGGRHVLHEIPERRAMSIDTLDEFERADALVKSGVIHFPWLTQLGIVPCVP